MVWTSILATIRCFTYSTADLPLCEPALRRLAAGNFRIYHSSYRRRQRTKAQLMDFLKGWAIHARRQPSPFDRIVPADVSFSHLLEVV